MGDWSVESGLALTCSSTNNTTQPVNTIPFNRYIRYYLSRCDNTIQPDKGLVAAAVFVQGAGSDLRPASQAEALARLGIAVLVYDKRGVGRSGGVYVGDKPGEVNVSRENLRLLGAVETTHEDVLFEQLAAAPDSSWASSPLGGMLADR